MCVYAHTRLLVQLIYVNLFVLYARVILFLDWVSCKFAIIFTWITNSQLSQALMQGHVLSNATSYTTSSILNYKSFMFSDIILSDIELFLIFSICRWGILGHKISRELPFCNQRTLIQLDMCQME